MRTRVKVLLVVILVVLTLCSCVGIDLLPMFALLEFVFGCIAFVWRVLPQVSVNPGGLVMAVLALGVSAMLAHSIGAWLWNPSHAERPWRFKWTAMFLAMVVMMFAAGISVVAITHQTIWLVQTPGRWFAYSGMTRANRVKCASNLRQIGQAIRLYANDNGGRFPDSLPVLVTSTDLNPEVFVCPSSNAEKAVGANMQEILEQLTKPEHMSYVYVGKGMTTSTPVDTVVAYELPQNHDGDGGNVLYADGHVEWFDGKHLKDIITQAETRPAPQTAPATTRPVK
ncbi:MAG: hypothetical protein ABSH20_05975 [Tepidisphaeraceae bacterium]|jgi:prepilin-type processing-associated H-X9-DG protein